MQPRENLDGYFNSETPLPQGDVWIEADLGGAALRGVLAAADDAYEAQVAALPDDERYEVRLANGFLKQTQEEALDAMFMPMDSEDRQKYDRTIGIRRQNAMALTQTLWKRVDIRQAWENALEYHMMMDFMHADEDDDDTPKLVNMWGRPISRPATSPAHSSDNTSFPTSLAA